MSAAEELDEAALCDCGERFHELECAYLDALLAAKIADGEIVILDEGAVR